MTEHGTIPNLPAWISYPEQVEYECSVVITPEGDVALKQSRVGTFTPSALGKGPSFIDPMQLRDDFADIDSVDSAQRFLSSCGPWLLSGTTHQVLRWDDLKRWQKHFENRRLLKHSTPPDQRVGLLKPKAKVDVLEGSVQSVKQNGSIVAALTISCRCAVEAISAIIELDRLKGIRYRKCRRKTCPNPGQIFELGYRDDREFCDEKCQRAEGERLRRERKAQA